MIRIAMCDDNLSELEQFRDKIETYIQKNFPEEEVTLKEYTSSIELDMQSEEKDVADIFILDVDMPGMNGFQLAKSIRDRNAGAIIFFLTAHMEMADKGYQVQALRYINKLGNDQTLERALIAAVGTLKRSKEKFIAVKYDRNLYRIALDQIFYVQTARKELTIYTRTMGAIRDSRGLKELYDSLQDVRFIFIDRGTFVNADYIRKIEGHDIVMQDGTRLAISRRLVSDVKEAVAAYWSL